MTSFPSKVLVELNRSQRVDIVLLAGVFIHLLVFGTVAQTLRLSKISQIRLAVLWDRLIMLGSDALMARLPRDEWINVRS